MHHSRHSALLLAVFFGLVGLAPDAHAYLDPSTGSMILSAIVGLFATVGLAVKTYWYKLKNLLSGRSRPTGPAGGNSPSRVQAPAPAPANKTGQPTGQHTGQPTGQHTGQPTGQRTGQRTGQAPGQADRFS